MNHPHRSKLFDCSPAIAAKLARVANIAIEQRLKSELASKLTFEDEGILIDQFNRYWRHSRNPQASFWCDLNR